RRDGGWDRRHDRRHGDWGRGGRCSPDLAVAKARDFGMRRARIADISPRRVVVEGFRHGDYRRMIFLNDRGCPLWRSAAAGSGLPTDAVRLLPPGRWTAALPVRAGRVFAFRAWRRRAGGNEKGPVSRPFSLWFLGSLLPALSSSARRSR